MPDPTPPQPSSTPTSRASAGLAAGIVAYALWGVFPLYFPLLEPAGPFEIIAHRVVWSLVFCLVALAVTRSWRQFAALWRTPRTLLLLGVAAVFLAVNWTVYVYGVNSGHVVDASLGYFINPLVTVLLAVIFLHERLRPVQWAALGLGAVAVLVVALGHGTVPWIAVVLALSFGFYGLIKSRVGGRVEAAPGLAAETALLSPVAAGYWIWLSVQGTSTFGAYGPWHAAALASAGVVTAALRCRDPAPAAVGGRAHPVPHTGAAAPHRRRRPARGDVLGPLGRLRAGLGGARRPRRRRRPEPACPGARGTGRGGDRRRVTVPGHRDAVRLRGVSRTAS